MFLGCLGTTRTYPSLGSLGPCDLNITVIPGINSVIEFQTPLVLMIPGVPVVPVDSSDLIIPVIPVVSENTWDIGSQMPLNSMIPAVPDVPDVPGIPGEHRDCNIPRVLEIPGDSRDLNFTEIHAIKRVIGSQSHPDHRNSGVFGVSRDQSDLNIPVVPSVSDITCVIGFKTSLNPWIPGDPVIPVIIGVSGVLVIPWDHRDRNISDVP